MRQSNAIFGALFIAFLIFITARGELGQYLALLLQPATSANATPASGSIFVLPGSSGGAISTGTAAPSTSTVGGAGSLY